MAKKQQGLYKSNYYDSTGSSRVQPVGGQHTQGGSSGAWQGSYVGASYPGSTYPVDSVVQYSRVNPVYSKKGQKGRKKSLGKKVAIGVLVAFVIAILGVGSAAALYVNSVNQELTQGSKSEEDLMAIQDALASDSETTFEEPFYMLLIGTDTREDGSVEGSRSDTNIVVRVDPIQNVVTMVSIPRDTQINISGYGTNKFNAAYNYLGTAGTIEEAEKLLDIEISHYAEVDFSGLSSMIDAIGGVDINVEETVDDPNIAGIYIEAGEQHLNGEEALAYARTRQYVDGDFTRTSHQRELVTCVLEQILALPLTDLPRVISAGAECVTTDLSVDQLIALAQQFQGSLDTLVFYSAMVPSYTGTENGISYVYTDTTVLSQFMELVNTGQDPSTVTASTSSSSSSSSDSSSTYDYGYNSSGGYYDNSYSNGSYYSDSYYYDNSYYDNSSSYGGSGYDSSGYSESGSSGSDTYGSGSYDTGTYDTGSYDSSTSG